MRKIYEKIEDTLIYNIYAYIIILNRKENYDLKQQYKVEVKTVPIYRKC